MTSSKAASTTKWIILLVLIGLIALPIYDTAWAQEQEALTLSLRRDFGYSSGTGKIQGTFTLKVEGPESLARVVFLIDGQEMGEVTRAPFELKFQTGAYPLGVHTLSATGTTTDGQELQSNEQRREFVPAEEGWQAAGRIAVPIISVVFLVMLFSFVLPLVLGRGKRSQLPLGAPRSYGVLGGAICPKCGRPFAMHIWGFNLVGGKYDRCPHCGRWSLVHHTSPDALRAAEAAELQQAQPPPGPSASAEEAIRKDLDDSRYQDL
jgi:hypothetical protein